MVRNHIDMEIGQNGTLRLKPLDFSQRFIKMKMGRVRARLSASTTQHSKPSSIG